MATRDPKLAYVLHEGRCRHVSHFVHLPPKDRPQVFCPGCEKEVILHLGPKYVYHAAHLTDSLCPLKRPETAVHFNTKVFLSEQLSNAHRLLIAQPCYGWWAPTIENVPGQHIECAGRHRTHL